MAIQSISLTNFRSLENSTLEFNPDLNLITGGNGAGKTSLLEAINVVSQGKSPTCKNLDEVIRHREKEAVLFARYNYQKAGVRRIKGRTDIKLNGQKINRLSALASQTPVVPLNHISYELAISRPGTKRSFLDWCLFHVEHLYPEIWRKYSHTLRQRNALLKKRVKTDVLDYWDEELVSCSTKINRLRKTYAKSIHDVLIHEYASLIEDLHVDLEFKQGWDNDKDLLEVYQQNRERELRYGYTLYGVQRDSLKITSFGHSVNAVLSRGQVKRLSVAMYLSAIQITQRTNDKKIIVLVDDLTSELDKPSIEKILLKLQNSETQVFVTSIKPQDLPILVDQDCSMFHVEHGIIRPGSNS